MRLWARKLAIISPKPQTTRNRIQGVVHIAKRKGRDAAQIVLIDTPGVHKPDSSLGRKMMVEVREALEGCDLVLVIMDMTRRLDPRDQFALDLLKQSGTPSFLILNKVDLIRDKARLLPVIEEYRKLHAFREVIPVSALKREGLELLLKRSNGFRVTGWPAVLSRGPDDRSAGPVHGRGDHSRTNTDGNGRRTPICDYSHRRQL